jgi:hypothetical protein
MSVHDKAAARERRAVTLEIVKHGEGYSQCWLVEGLTEREIDERKAMELSTHAPGTIFFNLLY